MQNNTRQTVAALALVISASGAGFAAWQAHEGFTDKPVIPTQGDVPTIGYGSTHYEDGRKVKLTDQPVTRERAKQLALNLMTVDAKKFAASLDSDAVLHPQEFDVYLDFVGQYGIGNWNSSSMRRQVNAQDHPGACKSLLKYRFAAKYDCSTLVNGNPNRRCWGVWARQLTRHNQCMEVQ